jgi:hypothetical protein
MEMLLFGLFIGLAAVYMLYSILVISGSTFKIVILVILLGIGIFGPDILFMQDIERDLIYEG